MFFFTTVYDRHLMLRNQDAFAKGNDYKILGPETTNAPAGAGAFALLVRLKPHSR